MTPATAARSGPFTAFVAVLQRDLLLAARNRAEALQPLAFFVLTVALYPLGVSPEPDTLRAIAPGIVWIAALLSALFAMDGLFRGDFDDGSLEQLVLAPHPLPWLALAKVLAHWLVSGLPMTVLAPLFGVWLALPVASVGVLAGTLLLGTPLLSLIGAIGAALTVALRRGGVLMTLLVLPLYIPVLIFATNAVVAAGAGLPVDGQFYLLGGLLALALVAAPFAIAAALRISLN